MPATNKPLRAVALIRMSTDKQINSPERQRDAFAAYCERWGLEDCGHYEDLGVSATHTRAADRAGLQALLADARRRRFDVVFVEELSRAARRSEDFFPLQAELRRLGVALVTKHDDPTREVGAAQRFSQGVMALAAELEAGLLSERVRSALALRVKQGLYRGGNISLGYRWCKEMQSWAVDEAGAEVARRVFRTYLDCSNLEEAARALNAAGLVTGKGNHWSGSSVRALVRSPMYRGYLRFAGEDYPCPGLPEVIPPALLAEADRAIANCARRPQRADQSADALFTGLLRCPSCGAWLSLHVTQDEGRRYLAYYCWRGRQEPHACENRRYVGQGPLERALVPVIHSYLETMAAAMPSASRRKQGPPAARTLERLETERQRVLRLHVTGRISEAELDVMLGQVQARREAAAQAVPERQPLTRQQVQELARQVGRSWWVETIPRRRKALQRMVEYITPDPDHLGQSTIVWSLW